MNDDAFSMMFTFVFILIIGIIAYGVISQIIVYSKNKQSPRLSVDALIVSKRTDVDSFHDNQTMVHHAFSSYYICFEFASTDRLELQVNEYNYGMLCVGDRGKLTFQGTQFIGFERIRSSS